MLAVGFDASEARAKEGAEIKETERSVLLDGEGAKQADAMGRKKAHAAGEGHDQADEMSSRTQEDGQLTVQESESEVDMEHDSPGDDDDWLYSEDEQPARSTTSSKATRAAAALRPFRDDSARHLKQDGAGPQMRRAAGRSLAKYEEMSTRDTSKVISTFQDTGYREGITAGKLSTLQEGFDQGFSEVGVPYGRQLGMVKGELDVLRMACSQLLGALRQHAGEQDDTVDGDLKDDDRGNRRARSQAHIRLRNGHRAVADAPSLSSNSLLFLPPSFSLRHVEGSQLRELLKDAESISKRIHEACSEVSDLTLERLAEPDWEALEHELEHANLAGISDEEGGDREGEQRGMGQVQRETQEQRQARERILPSLESRRAEMEQMFAALLAEMVGAHAIHTSGQQQVLPSRDDGIA